MTKHEFTVQMTCDGCKKSVNAVLSKTPGVEKVDINLQTQSVVVEGTASQEDLLKAIQKTGNAYRTASLNVIGKKVSVKS